MTLNEEFIDFLYISQLKIPIDWRLHLLLRSVGNGDHLGAIFKQRGLRKHSFTEECLRRFHFMQFATTAISAYKRRLHYTYYVYQLIE